jgi:hypothetical protein
MKQVSNNSATHTGSLAERKRHEERARYYAEVLRLASKVTYAVGSCGDPAVSHQDHAGETVVRILELEARGAALPGDRDQPARAYVAKIARGKRIDCARSRRRVGSLDAVFEARGDAALLEAGLTSSGPHTAPSHRHAGDVRAGDDPHDPLHVVERRDTLREELLEPALAFRDRLVARRGQEGHLIWAGLLDGKAYREIVAEVGAACPKTRLTEEALRRLVYVAKRDDERLRRWLERRRPPTAPASRGGGRRAGRDDQRAGTPGGCSSTVRGCLRVAS